MYMAHVQVLLVVLVAVAGCRWWCLHVVLVEVVPVVLPVVLLLVLVVVPLDSSYNFHWYHMCDRG